MSGRCSSVSLVDRVEAAALGQPEGLEVEVGVVVTVVDHRGDQVDVAALRPARGHLPDAPAVTDRQHAQRPARRTDERGDRYQSAGGHTGDQQAPAERLDVHGAGDDGETDGRERHRDVAGQVTEPWECGSEPGLDVPAAQAEVHGDPEQQGRRRDQVAEVQQHRRGDAGTEPEHPRRLRLQELGGAGRRLQLGRLGDLRERDDEPTGGRARDVDGRSRLRRIQEHFRGHAAPTPRDIADGPPTLLAAAHTLGGPPGPPRALNSHFVDIGEASADPRDRSRPGHPPGWAGCRDLRP